MPKIRDLGINVIPVAMRAPENGPGGGILACPAVTDCGGTNKCTELSPNCEPHSGQHPRPPHCAAQSNCPEHSYPPKAYYAGGFTPDAIVQLKQQLRHQVGNQPVN